MTTSAELYAIAKTALLDAELVCSAKVKDTGSRARSGNTWAIGERVELELHYYLYVKKAEAEKAVHVIQVALQNRRNG